MSIAEEHFNLSRYTARPVAAPNPLEKITIIGGNLSGNGQLSDNDRVYLEHTTRVLNGLCVPVIENPSMDVMNILGMGHGGPRDFLKEKISTDILIMANVAYQQSNGGAYLSNTEHHALSPQERFQLKAAMTVSDENANEKLWQKQFNSSGATIIIVVGCDDFPPQKIAGEKYVALLQPVAGFQGILFSRDYLCQMAPALKHAKSPLHSVASIAASCSDVTMFTRKEYNGTSVKFEPHLQF